MQLKSRRLVCVMQLQSDSVKMSAAMNDCFCHIAESHVTVPLDKIQDVQLQESWVQTMFGLKQVGAWQLPGPCQLPH